MTEVNNPQLQKLHAQIVLCCKLNELQYLIPPNAAKQSNRWEHAWKQSIVPDQVWEPFQLHYSSVNRKSVKLIRNHVGHKFQLTGKFYSDIPQQNDPSLYPSLKVQEGELK
jgi:hypothetical protein